MDASGRTGRGTVLVGGKRREWGLTEVSGKETLAFRGHVDNSAPAGTPGTLLLHPRNINIVPAGAPGSVTEVDGVPILTIAEAFARRGDEDFDIDLSVIDNATSGVIVSAIENIDVQIPITMQNGVGLVLRAGDSVFLNNHTVTTNGGSIRATRMTERGGKLVLDGGESGVTPGSTDITRPNEQGSMLVSMEHLADAILAQRDVLQRLVRKLMNLRGAVTTQDCE